ncbi:hypothetical protein Mnod_0013 [Methylobacterium nodulans ORS 2060]|uniref:Uncharacterized protein n=1 Tax=Methylobacterium nodulans (strain LMG 21967 / CNCM I-2342 / ORS 2060) TaxID=460265 RepID=B8IT02_METNO|nr:hypothetical protein Mnod_0013 [Methylobacterium nodulans ORS 2060]
MRALARAWRSRAFQDPQDASRNEAARPVSVTARPIEREQEHRGLTARELIRMAQSARIHRN